MTILVKNNYRGKKVSSEQTASTASIEPTSLKPK